MNSTIHFELLLKEEKVLDIAKLFNVSKATIQHIKEGKTWQSLGKFKIEGKASRISKGDLETLYKLFELKIKVKYIQKKHWAGFMTEEEKFYQSITIWAEVKKVIEKEMKGLFDTSNHIFNFIDSGAR